MAYPFTNQGRPFGSARFSIAGELAKAGLFTRDAQSLFVGFFDNLPIWYSGMGGVVSIAGPRSGKLTTQIAMNVCTGGYPGTLLILDIKGELAAISRFQVPGRQSGINKFCIYWNPGRVHGLPYHRINPVAFIRADSPTLISDVKVFCENTIVSSGAAQSAYFEGRAREMLEALVLAIVKRDGVLTLPALHDAINLMVRGGEAWLDLAFEMADSGFASAARIEEEIADSRDDTSGGIKGILGEITRAFACLSDPALLNSVSPPYDFCLSELTREAQVHHLYLMPPSDFVESWAAVIKTCFVAARTYKARAPAAPRQTWLLDECGNLGAFPLVVRLFTRDAGMGIRPWAFFQSTKQMNAIAKDGESLLTASAACRCFYGIRDLGTARIVSEMIGSQTLGYVEPQRFEAARQGAIRAARSLFTGGDPLQAGLELAHHRRMAGTPMVKERRVMNADELLGLAPDKMVLFADGLAHPVYADRYAYYDLPAMAGRYHPNPYHPPVSHVQVMTPRGPVWRPVIVEPVPSRFAHYPQYTNGTWSRIG